MHAAEEETSLPDDSAPERDPDVAREDERVDEAPGDTDAIDAPVDVEALQAEAARAPELEERLKRVEAEFVNETKRIRRNASEERKYAIERVVVDLLPVVDALGGAREALGEGGATDPMREGLDLVDKQLTAVLEQHGVTRIEALGQPFDPGRHQAMMVVERPDLEPQTVCEVLRHGYELNGRVVRPVEVIVVKAPPADDEESGETETPPGASEDSGEEA